MSLLTTSKEQTLARTGVEPVTVIGITSPLSALLYKLSYPFLSRQVVPYLRRGVSVLIETATPCVLPCITRDHTLQRRASVNRNYNTLCVTRDHTMVATQTATGKEFQEKFFSCFVLDTSRLNDSLPAKEHWFNLSSSKLLSLLRFQNQFSMSVSLPIAVSNGSNAKENVGSI